MCFQLFSKCELLLPFKLNTRVEKLVAQFKVSSFNNEKKILYFFPKLNFHLMPIFTSMLNYFNIRKWYQKLHSYVKNVKTMQNKVQCKDVITPHS